MPSESIIWTVFMPRLFIKKKDINHIAIKERRLFFFLKDNDKLVKKSLDKIIKIVFVIIKFICI